MVYDGETLTEYVNGQSGKIVDATGNLKSITYLAIGECCNTNVFFKGTIDDVRIYSRALSESEIQELYTGETSCTASDAGFVSSSLDIHMPSLNYETLFGTMNILRADFEYYGEGSNGELLWKLKNYG